MTTRRSILVVISITIWSFTSATHSHAAPPPGKGKNELKLSVTVTPSSIAEGEQATGTVSHDNTDLSSPVEVTLASSDTGEATVSSPVTIPAGSASTDFTVTAIADGVADGDQSVTITATGDGYQPGSANLTVTDPVSAPPVEFTIQEIPIPGNSVWINGITNGGFVYGWFAEYIDGVTLYKSGYVYDQFEGVFYDLNRDTGVLAEINSVFGINADASSVVGMNSRGDMVGYVEISGGVRKGFAIDPTVDGLFSPNPQNWTVEALPDFDSDYTYGRRINELGEVLGAYSRGDGTSDAYLYNPWLDTQQNPMPAMALGVNLENFEMEFNNLAQVAGIVEGGTAFLFDPATSRWQWFTEVEYLAIRGLNDEGTFVGNAYTVETYAGGKKQRRGSRIAFRYTTTLENLAAGGFAKGINASSDVAIHYIGEPTILHTGVAPDFVEQTLALTNLIADDDPLKSTFLNYSPEVFAISDRDITGYSQAVVRLHDVPDQNGVPRNVVVVLTPRVP